MSAITCLVVATALGAAPDGKAVHSNTREPIQLAQAFSTPPTFSNQNFSAPNFSSPNFSTRPVQTRHEGSFARMSDRSFGVGPEVPHYSSAIHSTPLDDLPERPNLDLIPFLDRTQLGANMRRTAFDANASLRPGSNSYVGNTPNTYTSNTSLSNAPYSANNTQFGNAGQYGSSGFGATPTNYGANQPYSAPSTFGSTPSTFGNSPSYGSANNFGQPQYGSTWSNHGTSPQDQRYAWNTPSGATNPLGNSWNGTSYGSGSGVLSPPSTQWNDGWHAGLQPRAPSYTNPTGYMANSATTYRDPYHSAPAYNTPYAANPPSNFNSGFPQRSPTTAEAYDRLANNGFSTVPPVGDTYRNDPRYADNRNSLPPSSGFDFNRSRSGLPTASISRNGTNPGFSTTFASLLLFASLGGNLYLGWLARDFYWRYRDLAWETRGTPTNPGS